MKSFVKFLIIITATFFLKLNTFSINKKEALSFKKKGQIINRIDIQKFFKLENKKVYACKIETNPIILQKAAKYSLNLLKNRKYSKNKIINNNKVKETLRFIIALIENDKKNKRPFRILNPNFLNKYFRFIKWSGDITSAKKDGKSIIPGKIHLTHYATFEIKGSYKQTKKYSCALYKIINKYFDNDLRFKISKQNVLRGRLNQKIYHNKVKPLVWVTRDGLEEALMQGTTIVKMPDGKKRIFCVNKNNGFAYDKNIKNRKQQKRYWYFKEETNNKHFEKSNIMNFGQSVFAGDIYNIGLGKIIVIKYKNNITKKIEMRLGILADSGGAFINNLYQLDYYAGIFKNQNKFYNWISSIPRNVQSFILIKKS